MTQKKKFLITGAAGFLGANLVERVVADGHSVLAMDNLSMGKLANLEGLLGRPGVEFLQADVTQASAFEKVAGDFDCIVHLAAFKIPRYGKAIDTLKINYQGTENALEYARRTRMQGGARVDLRRVRPQPEAAVQRRGQRSA